MNNSKLKIEKKLSPYYKIFWYLVFLTIIVLMFLLYRKPAIQNYYKYIKIIDRILLVLIIILEYKRKKLFVSIKNYLLKGLPIYILLIFYTLLLNHIFIYLINKNSNSHLLINLFILSKHIFILLFFISVNGFYSRFFQKVILNPQQAIVLGFFIIILLGSFFLYEPFSVSKNISFVDAFFTSTSAVCVTGLIVKDTPKDFSFYGKLIILILIQIGGIGIMALYASIFLIFSSSPSISLYYFTSSAYDVERERITFSSLLKIIFTYTFLMEFIGAFLFFLRFKAIGFGLKKSFELSIFHSISAFCNAGFSLFSDSFIKYSGDLYLNLILIFLIVSGGIGFLVAYDIYSFIIERGIKKRRNIYLKPQTILVLIMYLILIFAGSLLFYISENNNILKNMKGFEKILASIFQSVTARTAGFNTVDIGKLRSSTYILLVILMFIGASSGSTGGGIKVTTFFILSLTFISFTKERSKIIFMNREIPFDTVKKAISVFFAFLGFVVIWIFLLALIENFSIEKIVFEVFSAFGTVGLSTGITPYLSDLSKVLIIIAMFTGRVGPLTLVSAMSRMVIERNVKYPETNIMVG